MTVEVKQLAACPSREWDHYVEQTASATFFHLSGWGRVIESAYGHKPYYLYAVNGDNKICGIIPLVHVRSLLFGSALVSNPFCVYGGVVADDEPSRQALLQSASDLATRLRVGHLELRQHQVMALGGDWLQKERYATFIKPIPHGRDAILAGVKYKQRAVVRKALKAPLQYRFDNDLNTFYRLYSTSVRDLGTPVFPKRYFRLLRDEFFKQCDIMHIYDTRTDTPVTAVLSFYFRDQVLPYYAGQIATPARELKANDRMYFELMCAADARGYRTFDFGRSKNGTGPYNYKRHWGFEAIPLPYQYRLIQATALPENNPTNPRYQRFIELWKKLPLPVSQLLGPRLARSLG